MKYRRFDIYKIFWVVLIVLIPLFPLSGINYGVDIGDVGFSLSQYRFFFSDIDTIYLPLYLTDLIGAVLMRGMEFFGIPVYLGFGVLWAVSCWYLCFLGYRLYLRYWDDRLVLPALALAALLAKCNFHYFIYNTTVALMALTGLYFLVRAVNDKKPWLLGIAALFFVLATLCKISALLQFAAFAILFYDLYRKRDWGYFRKQIGYCVLGVMTGVLLACVLFSFTCGIRNYGQMVLDMFVYAGSSGDGHTIGNMIAINVQGAVRGLMLLIPVGVVLFLTQRDRAIESVLRYLIPAGLLIMLIGQAAGLASVPYIGKIYGIFLDYYNVLAVLMAYIYVCVLLVCVRDRYTGEQRVLAISAGLLTVLMPIGSNVGISHLCNEMFLVLPALFISAADLVRDPRSTVGEKETGPKRFLPTAGVWILAAMCAWYFGLVGYQSLYLTRAYLMADADRLREFSLTELRGMRYDSAMVENLEETVGFLRESGSAADSMVVAGSAPLLYYLSGIRPLITGCGGWIETDYVSAEEISEQLIQRETNPVVVFRQNTSMEPSEKMDVIMDFVDANHYREVFSNEDYIVFME